jgi:hypothetical protein
MLDGLKRLFTGPPAPTAEGWEGIAPWAASRHYAFRDVPNEGFVVDGRLDATPWRLEWGPSQRPYIRGQELRLRAEMGLPADLQLVVMNRPLQETMEQAVFDQYVEGVQTRIDNQTPPEMRWLVMFPKLPNSEMGPLRERFIAVSSVRNWLSNWLEGPLTHSLGALRVDASVPMVLMIGRGRLMLRTALAEAELPTLQMWLRLFETALREGRRVAGTGPESASPTTQPSPWHSSALPGDERKP